MQQEAVLISVVLPTLNAAQWLPHCLASLAEQSFKNFEVLVVDGGSNDETLSICHDFSRNADFSILAIQDDGVGVYQAMNKGFNSAQGSWCYFMGADDILFDENVFNDLTEYLKDNSHDLVYGDVLLKSNLERYCGPSSIDALLNQRNICHQSIFYSKKILHRMGGYSLRYPFWSDWDLNLRIFKTPDIRTIWINRLIAIYNDQSGLSQQEDIIFAQELPVFINQKLKSS